MPSLAGGSSSFQSGTTVVNVNSLTLQDISANRIAGNLLEFGTLSITSNLTVPTLFASNVVASNLVSFSAANTIFNGNATFTGNAAYAGNAVFTGGLTGNTFQCGNILVGGNQDFRLIVSNGQNRLAFNQQRHFNSGGTGAIGVEMSGNVLIQNVLWVGVGASDTSVGKLKLASGLATGFDASVDWGTGNLVLRCTDLPTSNGYLERLRLSRTSASTFVGPDVNLASASQVYQIAGNTVLGATALGNSVISSNLSSLANGMLVANAAGVFVTGNTTLANVTVNSGASIAGALRSSGWATIGIGNSNGIYPAVESGGLSTSWNFTAFAREQTLMNLDHSGSGFRLYQRTGTSSSTLLATIAPSGTTINAGGLAVQSGSLDVPGGIGTLLSTVNYNLGGGGAQQTIVMPSNGVFMVLCGGNYNDYNLLVVCHIVVTVGSTAVFLNSHIPAGFGIIVAPQTSGFSIRGTWPAGFNSFQIRYMRVA
jgi:hypothetical protein